MKKIFLILLLLVPSLVRAEEMSKKLEKEKYYKYYYLEKKFANTFYKEGENPREFPHQSDIFTYGEKLISSSTKPQIEEDIVEEKIISKYKEKVKIRYLILENLNSDYAINLQEIEVWNKSTKLNYQITCSNVCSGDLIKSINNNVQSGEYNYITNGTNLVIDLKEEYFPEDITLKIYLASAYGKTLRFHFIANEDGNLNNLYYHSQRNESLAAFKEIDIALKKIEHEERYQEEIKEMEGDKIENGIIVEQSKKYFYKERYYLYYQWEKKYLEGYYQDIHGLEKEEDDFQEREVPKEYIEVPVEVKVPVEVEKVVEREVEKKIEVPVEVEKEVPVEVEKIVVKNVPTIEERVVEIEKKIEIPRKEPQKTNAHSTSNYILEYLSYFVMGIMLKKVSFFKG